VLVNRGKDCLIRDREDITDIVERQIIPGRLMK
jgi:hypothetical protein